MQGQPHKNSEEKLKVPTEKDAQEMKTTVPPNWDVEESDKKPAANEANWDVYPMVYKEYVDGHVKRIPSQTELAEIHETFHPEPQDKRKDASVVGHVTFISSVQTMPIEHSTLRNGKIKSTNNANWNCTI